MTVNALHGWSSIIKARSIPKRVKVFRKCANTQYVTKKIYAFWGIMLFDVIRDLVVDLLGLIAASVYMSLWELIVSVGSRFDVTSSAGA